MSREFRTPGWFGKHPAAGILMILIGGLVFGLLAYQVQAHGSLLDREASLETRLHLYAVNTATSTEETLTFGFFLGKEVTEVGGAILAIYLIHKKFWRELAMVIFGWSGGAGIWYVLTRFFDRPRPEAQMGVIVHDPSFPSGHAMQAVLSFGMVAYFLLPHLPSLAWKWIVVIVSILAVLFIGASRLLQGGHYPSDLVAGYALGIAWAGLVYTVIERIGHGRKA